MMRIKEALFGLGVLGLSLLLQGCATTGDGDGTALSGPRGEVVMAALSQVGTRYQYGAASPGQALDCSALTQHAYRAAGVKIPRMSLAQRKAAMPVDPARVKPGDLVFFRIGGDDYHVGVMVDQRRFVHASTSQKQVRLASLAEPYWQRHLIGAGTYLN